jgi:benzoyl-CoA reductase/2-hydroxyglutaryl-CoA dehydratase subunit BcrC/BadD/HgdB
MATDDIQERRLAKFKQERDDYELVSQTFGQSPTGEEKLYAPLAKVYLDHHNEIIRCAEEGKPFIASYFQCEPEIFVAMDLPWYTFLTPTFMGSMNPTLEAEIDATESMFGKDLCTIMRTAGYAIEADTTPIPTAVVALLHPCDATTVIHQLMASNENWRNVPIFGADPPYWEDERSLDYYVDEIKRMVSFLEEHTGLKLDMDRLREVIEESNKMYVLWAEYNELRRAVPCPHGFGLGLQAFGVAQNLLVGHPIGTQWFKDLLADAEQLAREKKGKVENERIRLFWFDVQNLGLSFDLFPWLEEEWGAVVVMDMFGFCPYTQIDTSNEETMFRGLAQRYLYEVPMIRQARGTADNFLGDIIRAVKDYKVNCVVYPGHMGHKDGSATVGMMRETCRDLGVSFLHIGMDIFDSRYTPIDEIKNKFSQLFSAMGY